MSAISARERVSLLVLWLVLAAPGAWLLARYLSGADSYGQFIHASGDWSVWLLIATLAVTPGRRFIPGFPSWLARRRRDLGVASFGYAAGHLGAYVIRKADPVLMLEEGLEAGLLTGWIALAAMLALAITSNDLSVRAMGRGWKRLHLAVYPTAILVGAHWWLTAFDTTTSTIHLGIIAVLLLMRLIPRRHGRA